MGESWVWIQWQLYIATARLNGQLCICGAVSMGMHNKYKEEWQHHTWVQYAFQLLASYPLKEGNCVVSTVRKCDTQFIGKHPPGCFNTAGAQIGHVMLKIVAINHERSLTQIIVLMYCLIVHNNYYNLYHHCV